MRALSLFDLASAGIESRIREAVGLLPAPTLTDVEGSDEYRLFVWKNTVRKVLEEANHGLV